MIPQGIPPLQTQQWHTVTVERQSTGKYVNGLYVNGTTTTYSNIPCSAQPMTGDELLQNPAYARSKKVYRFFSQEFTFQERDIITTSDGTRFKVDQARPWENYTMVSSHSYAVGLLVEKD